jgi:hypothetical protein
LHLTWQASLLLDEGATVLSASGTAIRSISLLHCCTSDTHALATAPYARAVLTGDLITVTKVLTFVYKLGQATPEQVLLRRTLLDTGGDSDALSTSASSATLLEAILRSVSAYQAVPTRRITPENQVVSGLLLHQLREGSFGECSRYFAGKLARSCLAQGLPESNAPEASRAATDPFGTDPAFNPRSPMYDADTARNVWQFYNASEAAGEVAPTGTPYGFFSRPVASLPGLGFPVVFPVRMLLPAALDTALPCRLNS